MFFLLFANNLQPACMCIIHIFSCFVFLVCRAFLTRASDSEDCVNTSHVFDIK